MCAMHLYVSIRCMLCTLNVKDILHLYSQLKTEYLLHDLHVKIENFFWIYWIQFLYVYLCSFLFSQPMTKMFHVVCQGIKVIVS